VSLAFLGLLVVAGLFLVTQQWFYAAYRRKRGVWRSLRQRALTGPTPKEFRGMLRATFRRDPDPAVERARRIYLAALGAFFAYGAWFVLSGARIVQPPSN
jgi:hypothetical protein